MTLYTLASKIAKLEGKKHEASIGDIREIIGILSDIIYAESLDSRAQETFYFLFDMGLKRAKKKPKRVRK